MQHILTSAEPHDQRSHDLRPHDWPALDDAVHHGQHLFRQLLSAMAEPGTIEEVSLSPLPEGVGLSRAAWGVLLALCDLDSRIWISNELDRDGMAEAIAFHTGARIVTQADQADFALLTPQSCQDLPSFAEGSDTHPDRSTTLLVVLQTLANAKGQPSNNTGCWRLSGPGIADTRMLELDASAEVLMTRLKANSGSFPRGLDTILTCSERLVAIPRSTRIEPLAGMASMDQAAVCAEENA